MEFKWLNEGQIKTESNKIEMFAPAQSDFFFNNGAVSEEGITPESLCNAPFYHTEIAGDFVMRVKVSHDFKDTYDSASIMVMQDMKNWAKSCFEMTDFDTHAVVSVIARNGECDDANGCNIDGNEVWLQVCRCGNSFAFHYSVDGKKFYMTRFFNLPVGETVKVGLLPQAPMHHPMWGERGKFLWIAQKHTRNTSCILSTVSAKSSYAMPLSTHGATGTGGGKEKYPLNSGIYKKDFIARSCVYSHITVVGKRENIQRIVDALQEMQMVMREIAGRIQSGDFSLSDEGYRELKNDYLALVLTVVDIADGTAYLFEKENPAERRNWKAELELEQYRHVLEMDGRRDK